VECALNRPFTPATRVQISSGTPKIEERGASWAPFAFSALVHQRAILYNSPAVPGRLPVKPSSSWLTGDIFSFPCTIGRHSGTFSSREKQSAAFSFPREASVPAKPKRNARDGASLQDACRRLSRYPLYQQVTR
jgi:hypothetical protein